MFFKLKPGVGNHAETREDGTLEIYKAEEGRVIESSRNLDAMFSGKFERVEIGDVPEEAKSGAQKAAEKGAEGVAAPNKGKDRGEAEDGKSPQPKKSKKPKSSLGKNVTSRFPRAEEEDFKVFADGGAFYVVEAEEPEIPLHKKPLKRKGVEPFIEAFLKE